LRSEGSLRKQAAAIKSGPTNTRALLPQLLVRIRRLTPLLRVPLVHYSLADGRLKAVTATVTATVTAGLLTFFPVLVTLIITDIGRVGRYQLDFSTPDGDTPPL